MSGPDALTDLLRRHDQPVAPPAAFADRLEARLLAELGPAASARPDQRPEPVRAHARRRGVARPMLGRRPRWLDTAAAAVLVIGVMGGMLSQLTVRDEGSRVVDPPGTIAAPDFMSTTGESATAMEGESAARDGRYGGPSLEPGIPIMQWRVAREPGVSRLAVRPSGSTVYVLNGPETRGDVQPENRLEARRVSDGTVLWRTPTVANDVVVSADGAFLLESAEADLPMQTPRDGLIRKLDRATGAEMWRYDLVGVTWWKSYPSPVVVDDTVYFADGDSRVHALDVATGTPRWVTEAARSKPRPDDLNCVASPRLCQYGSFAVGDGLLYVLTSTARVVAIDADMGTVVWDIDIGGRYDLVRAGVWLTATRLGVIASISEYPPLSPEGGFSEPLAWQAALLDRAAGDEVWTRDDLEGVLHADDERVYVQVTSGGNRSFPCCTLVTLELATGRTVWERQAELGWLIGLTGNEASQLLTGAGRGPDDATIVSLDPATGVEEWHVVIGDAYAMLPVAAHGTFFATGSDGSLRAYRMVAAAEQVAVMEGGSPARDNRFAGPGPAEGKLVERWTASPIPEGGERYPTQVIPAGDALYQLFVGTDYDATESRFVGIGNTLSAYDLDTGAMRWSRADLRVTGVAAADVGVVVILPSAPGSAEGAGSGSRLALLHPTTGDERWSYPLGDAGRDNAWSPIIDGDTVYYADADATVYAVDLRTGAERWVSAAHPSAGVADACLVPSTPCQMNAFALGDGLIYAVTSASTLIAVDAADGSLRWEVDVVGRYGIPGEPLISSVAVPGGVMLGLGHTVDGHLGEAGSWFVRLDAADGAGVWERRVDGHPQSQVATDGERAFVGVSVLPGGCCAILAIDLLTGQDVWRSDNARVIPLAVVEGGDLYGAGTVSTGLQDAFLYALDPATGEERWRKTLPGTLTLPLAADGTMFVRNYDQLPEARLVAYQVIPAAGASPVASPAASPVAESPGEEPRAGAFAPDHVVSAGEAVNLRSEPSTAAGGATVIGVVTDGMSLQATGRTAPADSPVNGPWVQVELEDGTVGWLREADVSPTTPHGA